MINHLNIILPMFIRMLVSTSITPKQPHNIHPHPTSPQIPIHMSTPVIMPLPPMIVIKPLTHQKPVQSYRFGDFTFTLLVEEIFLDDIVARGTDS